MFWATIELVIVSVLAAAAEIPPPSLPEIVELAIISDPLAWMIARPLLPEIIELTSVTDLPEL